MKFTKKQIQDWIDYETVREDGLYNMFDPNARKSTGLTKNEYRFVMANYSELKEEAIKSGFWS